MDNFLSNSITRFLVGLMPEGEKFLPLLIGMFLVDEPAHAIFNFPPIRVSLRSHPYFSQYASLPNLGLKIWVFRENKGSRGRTAGFALQIRQPPRRMVKRPITKVPKFADQANQISKKRFFLVEKG